MCMCVGGGSRRALLGFAGSRFRVCSGVLQGQIGVAKLRKAHVFTLHPFYCCLTETQYGILML